MPVLKYHWETNNDGPHPPRLFPIPEQKKPVSCQHKAGWKSYLEPCVRCDRICNCNFKDDLPDIIVCSLDRQKVHLSSVVVRGSITLQYMVKHRQAKLEKEKLNNKVVLNFNIQNKQDKSNNSETKIMDLDISSTVDSGYMEGEIEVIDLVGDDVAAKIQIIDLDGDKTEEIEVIDLDDEDEIDEIQVIDLEDDDCDDNWGILDLISYDQNLMDLREGENIPTVGITARILMMVQTYMIHHLDQVDLAVEAERRAESFFASSLFPRPPKPPINYFKYEEWEEEFFKMDNGTMFEIMQAKHELFIYDLHFAVEKWLVLFRGQPAVEDFGTGFYLDDPTGAISPDCDDFRQNKKSPHNPRRKSTHCKPIMFCSIQRKNQFPKRKWNRY